MNSSSKKSGKNVKRDNTGKVKKPVKVVLKKITTRELNNNRIPSYGYIL